MPLLLGLLSALLISLLAWRAGVLSRSGAWAAALTGTLIFGLGGFPWAALLLTFFISSSILSRVFRHRKTSLSEKFSKGSRRDWGQVIANGGLGSVLALMSVVLPAGDWHWIAFIGAMAAVNADTWATELGVLNPTPPRLITNGTIVDVGTSGAISILGTLATVAGAALIGVMAELTSLGMSFASLTGIAIIAGTVGSLFDSLLGATIQAMYHCLHCEKETERFPQHTCGTNTTRIRGLSWLNNDLVNLLASLVGAGVAMLVHQLLSMV